MHWLSLQGVLRACQSDDVDRHEFRQFLPYPKVRRKLPNILSREEVARPIEAWSSLFEPTLLMVLCGTGKPYQHELTAAASYWDRLPLQANRHRRNIRFEALAR